MQKDARSRKIVLVAHCILNQNSKVLGLAQHLNMIVELVELLKAKGFGIIQMPCPEFTFAGLLRWSQTREQYDTFMFRRHCRRIAVQLVDQIGEYIRNGIRVSAIIGIEGSPSCGVNRVYIGYAGGEVEKIKLVRKKPVRKPGVFIKELASELEKRRFSIPFYGVDEKQIRQSVEEIGLLLED